MLADGAPQPMRAKVRPAEVRPAVRVLPPPGIPDGCSLPESGEIDLLASKLRTPPQVEWHLTQALEAGYQTGGAPVSADLVETLLSRQLDDPETLLTSHGYRLPDLVEQFDVKPAEIKALFSNQLDPTRSNELRDRMRAEGLPI